MTNDFENSLPSPAPSQQRVDKVVDQLHLAQTKTDSAQRSALILLVSLALFVALGAWFWSIEMVLYLLPILLFHELGHYVAMRYFDYRNVKMFFVPLLGAAVSGQHFNVPGWKKVIVSLAGPLPGILLAIPMAAVAVQTQNELWRNATLMILLINVFNLLPLLPLDGGWVAHALYFCRQPWLDVLFRLAAALTMIAVGVTWQIFFLTAFGALMLLAVPVAIRSANIARRIVSDGVVFPSDDCRSIPRSTVEKIVPHLPSTGPAATPKALAQQTRQIFDVINARPPGVAATIGLTLLYLMGWVVSIAVALALFLWPQWQRAWSAAPAISVVDSVEVYQADEQPVDDHTNRYFVLGKCDQLPTKKWITQWQSAADVPFTFAVAGDAILLSIDAAAAETEAGREMIKQFKAVVDQHYWFETDDVFCFTIKCNAADDDLAEKIARRAEDMVLFGNDLALVEPWSPLHTVSELQYQRRRTRRKLDAPFDAASDQALLALTEAANQDAAQDPKALLEQMEAYDLAFEKRYEAAVDRMRTGAMGTFDRTVLDHWDKRPGRFLAAPNLEVDEAEWRLELADLLGRIPDAKPVGLELTDGGLVSSQSAEPFRFSAPTAMVSSDGNQVKFSYIYFRNPITGLPAVLNWLRDLDCDSLQFQVIEADRWTDPLAD